MKVKIFGTSKSVADLEKEINDFIKDKDVIDIKQSETVCIYNNNYIESLTITVLYK